MDFELLEESVSSYLFINSPCLFFVALFAFSLGMCTPTTHLPSISESKPDETHQRVEK